MMDLYTALLPAGLTLDGTPTPIEFSRVEIEQFYAPLAVRVAALARPEQRALVAVAGPPGCGKSGFTTLLAAAINALAGAPLAACAGMDGWHWPNVYLDSHSIQRDGTLMTMRSIKGAPETYDTASLAAFLRAARRQPDLAFPVYSRQAHDPIPGGRLSPAQRILLLEGNYLLLDEPPWNDLRPEFDLTIFLRANPDALLEGLIQRHLRGGKDPTFAERHTRAVDLPNILRVLAHSAPAEIVVDKRSGREIEAVHLYPL